MQLSISFPDVPQGAVPPASKLLDGIHRAAFRGLRGAAFRGFRHFVRHGGSHALIGHGEYLRTKAYTQAAADAVFIYRIFHWKSPLCSYYTPSGSGICRKMRGFLHCMGKASPSAGRLKLSKNASLRASSLSWRGNPFSLTYRDQIRCIQEYGFPRPLRGLGMTLALSAQ